MKRLISEFGWTQDEIAAGIGKSRPAVANSLRLLTLAPEVVGLVESGRLSAGHARALVSVPKEKQFAFAEEALKRGYSVRETERAVKAFLTPPEVLQSEKAAAPQPRARSSKRSSSACARCSELRFPSLATTKRAEFISITIRPKICIALRKCSPYSKAVLFSTDARDSYII